MSKSPPAPWSAFRRFCLDMCRYEDTSKTGNPKFGIRPLPPNYVNHGRLVCFMVEHPVWGIAARPHLREQYKEVLGLTRDDELSVVLSSDLLMQQRLAPRGHSWKHVRDYIDLWSCKGPLAIEGDAWQDDPQFKEWWRERSRGDSV